MAPSSASSADVPYPDPIAYFRQAERRAAALVAYRCTLVRQERLGLFARLSEPQRLAAIYRSNPLAVRFDWMDPASDLAQASFIRGRYDDRVSLLPRRGFLGLPPVVSRFPPQDAITWGKARNAITDFGVHRMLARTLDRLEQSPRWGGAKVRYVDRVRVERTEALHFEILYPAADTWPNKRQDLLFDVARGLPLGTSLWLPDGRLDAAYFYMNLTPLPAPPPDGEFEITPPARRRSPSSQPADRDPAPAESLDSPQR